MQASYRRTLRRCHYFKEPKSLIAISIVSHGHGAMVAPLVMSLLDCPEISQIVVTHNMLEDAYEFGDPRVMLIKNARPKGFGANHNAAFRLCSQPAFCPLNPDIQLLENPFPTLLECLNNDARVALAAPRVQAPDGVVEDSVRHFPTVFSLFMKALTGADGRIQNLPNTSPSDVDWVAGMFMLFRSDAYKRLGGFDEEYFLYYEDVDICARIHDSGGVVRLCPTAKVVHDARRDSHRSLRHMRWHVASMMRYIFKRHVCRILSSRNTAD